MELLIVFLQILPFALFSEKNRKSGLKYNLNDFDSSLKFKIKSRRLKIKRRLCLRADSRAKILLIVARQFAVEETPRLRQ